MEKDKYIRILESLVLRRLGLNKAPFEKDIIHTACESFVASNPSVLQENKIDEFYIQTATSLASFMLKHPSISTTE